MSRGGPGARDGSGPGAVPPGFRRWRWGGARSVDHVPPEAGRVRSPSIDGWRRRYKTARYAAGAFPGDGVRREYSWCHGVIDDCLCCCRDTGDPVL